MKWTPPIGWQRNVARPAPWVPEPGDAAWIDFNPQAEREQAERRPAVVLSPGAYNGKVGLSVLCPIAHQVKGYPFEVAIPEGLDVAGVILADQLRSLGWRGRNATVITRLPSGTVAEVLRKVGVLPATPRTPAQ